MLVQKRTIGTIGVMGGLDFGHTQFWWSLAQMLQYNTEYVCQPGEIIHLVRSETTYHMTARNQICERMLGDWVLMLDTDHAFAPDLLERMLFAINGFQVDGHDVDVLTALYHYRAAPYEPVLYNWCKMPNGKEGLAHIGDWTKGARFVPIDSAGAGSLLIRSSVLERIHNELGEDPFSIRPPHSEDHSFFMRLRQLGIQAYCAPYIETAHLALRPITSADYQKSPELWTPVEYEDQKVEVKA